MNNINIKISKSNIPQFNTDSFHNLFLIKCIGIGSYGYVFKISDIFCIKLLIDHVNEFDNKYTDYTETQIIEKIIDNNNFHINCNNYAIGNIQETIYKDLFHPKIDIFVNNSENIYSDSLIIKKEKVYKFNIKVGFPIIIMPLFIPLRKYDTGFIYKNNFLIKMIDNLIKAQQEFLSIGLINLDFKLSNSVIDNQKIKYIDFGIVKNIESIDFILYNKNKYFLWKSESTINSNMSHIIGINVLEFISNRIYTLCNKHILYKFLSLQNISNDIKNLIQNIIENNIDWDIFVNEFNNIKSNYNIDDIIIPLNRVILL